MICSVCHSLQCSLTVMVCSFCSYYGCSALRRSLYTLAIWLSTSYACHHFITHVWGSERCGLGCGLEMCVGEAGVRCELSGMRMTRVECCLSVAVCTLYQACVICFLFHIQYYCINLLFCSAHSRTLVSSPSDSVFDNSASDAYTNGSHKCFLNMYTSTFLFAGWSPDFQIKINGAHIMAHQNVLHLYIQVNTARGRLTVIIFTLCPPILYDRISDLPKC